MYMKRQTTKKSWPIPRKGTKYVVVASHHKNNAIPLLVVLRDILKIVRNEKETRNILNSGKIVINGKIRKNKKFPVLPFDIISLEDKNYQLVFSDKGKFEVKETQEKNKTYNESCIEGAQKLLAESLQITKKDKIVILSTEGMAEFTKFLIKAVVNLNKKDICNIVIPE